MTLEKWVEMIGGPTALAERLKCGAPAVRVWLRGHGSPTLATAGKIVRMSKGAVSFAEILKATTRNVK